MRNKSYNAYGMTPKQADMFNEFIKEFMNQYDYYGCIRLGQSFYNLFEGIIFFEPYPLLFYCEDNDKVRELIQDSLIDYVCENY